MIATFLEFTQKRHISPIRDQLVNQLIAGSSGEEKTEFLRGQIRGLDRAIVAMTEASSKFAAEVDNE